MIEGLETRRHFHAGQLDPTFGLAGVATFNPTDGSEQHTLFAETTGGKILLGGSGSQPYILRLNPDGSPDESFGPGGRKSIALPGSATAVDPITGRILVGDSDGNLSLFTGDFTPDPSFGGGDGKVTLADIDIKRVAFGPGGKFVAAGHTDIEIDEVGIAVHRLTAGGAPDTTFDGDGRKTFGDPDNEGADSLNLVDLEVDAAGSLFIGFEGHIHTINPEMGDLDVIDLQVMKLTPAGQLDALFDADGIARLHFDNNRNAADLKDIELLPSGGVAALWYDTIGAFDDSLFFVTRLAGDGSFATPPKLTLHPQNDLAYDIETDADGRVLVLGRNYFDAEGDRLDYREFIRRYLPDGSLDTSYADNGTFNGQNHGSGTTPRFFANSAGEAFLAESPGFNLAADTTVTITKLQGGEGQGVTTSLNRRGTLIVNGRSVVDNTVLFIRRRDGRLIVRSNEFVQSFAPSRVKRIAIFANGGNDTVEIGEGVRGAYADGGDGDDTLMGGAGDDVFLGGAGSDDLFGNDGDDKLVGGGGNDYLLGGAGNDDLFGEGGSDNLSGAGGNDRLFGGPGSDDLIRGGTGTDLAASDDDDTFESIETLV